MSDPDDKKALLPALPAQAPVSKALMPVLPAQAPVTKAMMPVIAPVARALMPACPAQAPVSVALMPSLPVIPEASRTRSARSTRASPPSPPRRAEATLVAYSVPRARAEKAVGTFDALAGIAFPTQEERDATKVYRYVCVEAVSNLGVLGCIVASKDRPAREFTAAKQRLKIPPPRTNAETKGWRVEHGYRHTREIARLGDVYGHRRVAHCDEGCAVVDTIVQPEVPVHLFQSPDIPAWKSRVVSTDDSGSGGRRASEQDGLEIIRTVLEPNPERVKKQFAKQWPQRYADCNGTPETADQINQTLSNEINWADMDRADRCRDVVETIGPDDFARLWNLVLSCYTNPPPLPASAEEEPVSSETVVAPVA